MPQLRPLFIHALVVCAIGSLGARTDAAGTNPAPSLKIVALGQLDNPLLRQMAPVQCGPYFTFSPTDARGGGFLAFAIDTSMPGDPSGLGREIKVVSALVGAVRGQWCEKCDAPEVRGDGSSSQLELAISKNQWDLAPCLRHLKFSKR
ncbi:MAG TPA: hypothetical protein VF491_24690 [Vicinamibacterales bacterium]|jgi:hypothetical protein